MYYHVNSVWLQNMSFSNKVYLTNRQKWLFVNYTEKAKYMY